nr:hypothetical protein HK105_005344 [Polyrhizophydium stewartii]
MSAEDFGSVVHTDDWGPDSAATPAPHGTTQSGMGKRRMSSNAIKRNDSTGNELSLKSLINAAGMGNMLGFSGNLPATNENQLDLIIPNFVSKQVRRVCYQMCAEVALKSDGGSKDPLIVPPLKPSATEAFAAVVMVDVSGYSKLTAVLAERGPVGAELLTKTMKGYLDKIIQTIVSHGGDIVKFAGDAVIFCWKSEKAINLTDASQDKIRGELVYKASHCCLTLLTKLGTYDIDIEDCPTKMLRIHLGIGAGLIYDVLVGGEPGRWEHFIAGDGVNQLSQVLDLAKAGELALSHQALKWLACVIDIATVNLGDYDKRCIILTGLEKAERKGHAPPDVEDEIVFKDARQMEANVDLYKLFVDRTALFKLQADINQSRLFQMDSGLLELLNLTELRQVTTIFIKVGSLQVVHRNDILDESQRAISIVQAALHRYEGSLRQFHVDDKGAVILCFFGLPPLAHENDAGLGIRAGIEIRDKFLDIFDDFSIGITTGVVSYGGVGATGRAEYAVMGDAINMAARLMCHAEAASAILCDEKTFNLCESDFTFQNLGETKVKGKNSAISIFRPVASVPELNKKQKAAKQTESIDVIGREKERKAIVSALERMSPDADADTIVIKADGGQGLSTLISYAKKEAAKKQCNICIAQSIEMEKNTPYYAWQSIVHDLFELIDFGDVDEDGNLILPEPASSTVDLATSPGSVVSRASGVDGAFRRSRASGQSSVTSQTGSVCSNAGAGTRIKPPTLTLPNVKEINETEEIAPMSPFTTTPVGTAPAPGGAPGVPASATRGRRMSVIKPADSDEYLSEIDEKGGRPRFASALPSTIEGDGEQDDAGNWMMRVQDALEKLGESVEDAALFEYILPSGDEISTPDDQSKSRMRIHSLYKLLTSIFTKVCRKNRLLLVFNETQWMDTSSWELLVEILAACPLVVVFIFTRPEGSFDSKENRAYLTRVEEMKRTIKLTVEGLTIEETQRLIVSAWGGNPITGVSPKIVESIYRRTDGNPFFIRSLTVAMKESGQWRVGADGILSTQHGNFDFDKLVLGYDNQSIILAQFDRLDRNFQLFLKVAAVLGQRFLLDDVLYFLTGMANVYEQIDRKNYSQIIRGVQITDKYGFLQRENTTSEGMHFQFKSAVVRKCIYSMMVHKQRQQLHKHVATYYETRLNDANRHRYLIPIFEHFNEADGSQTRKKIHYLEMVANYYYERGSINDCIKYYKQLLDIADLPEGMDFKNTTIANWHRELGHSLFIKEEYVDADKHLLQALRLYGTPFPDTKFKISWRTRAEMRIRARKDASFFENFAKGEEQVDYSQSYRSPRSASSHSLSNIVNSSSRRMDLSLSTNQSAVAAGAGAGLGSKYGNKERNTSQNLMRDPGAVRQVPVQGIQHVLLILADLYWRRGQFERHRLCVLLGLNRMEESTQDIVLGRFFSLGALTLWMGQTRPSFAQTYMDAAQKLDARTDIQASIQISTNYCSLMFLMGKWQVSLSSTESVTYLGSIAGDTSTRLRALRMRSIIQTLGVSRAAALNTARDMYALATQKESLSGRFWSSLRVVECLFSMPDSFAELQDMAKIFDEIWSLQTANSTTPAGELAHSGIKMLLQFHLGVDFKASDFVAFTELLDKAQPLDWMSFQGLLYVAFALFAAFEKKALDSNAAFRKVADTLCVKANKQLKPMKGLVLADPLRRVFKGMRLLLGKQRTKAVAAWRKGLDPKSEVILVQAFLHVLISQYSDGAPAGAESAAQAKQLLQKLHAAHEFEKIWQNI